MPVNQDGVEVNEDGTPITDEQKETSDWTQVIELNNKTSVKPYSVNAMVTNTVPHNIPFLEVYRTDELYYKEYESPFSSASDSMSGSELGEDTSVGNGTDGTGTDSGSSSSSGGSNGSALWTEIVTIVNNHIEVSSGKKNQYVSRLVKANANWTAIAKIVNGHRIKGNANQNTVISAILKAKTRKYSNSSGSNSSKGDSSGKVRSKKLNQELRNIVKRYFKKTANVTTLVNRYMSAKTSRDSIGAVTNRSSVHLKNSVSPSTVNSAVYNAKHRYG